MADTTGISWSDATFNGWIGCEKVSPACAHCYAETFSTNRMGLSVWGPDAPRRITSEVYWRKPHRWARLAREGLLPDGSENPDGHRPRIFCSSLADVFEQRPDLDEPRERLLDLIYETPELDWMILTKRPEAMRDRFYAGGWKMTENLWLGTSIENARFTWRADVLREIPAAVRFISAEPLLGSLFEGSAPRAASRDRVAGPRQALTGIEHGAGGDVTACLDVPSSSARTRRPLDLTGIDWLIVGGESGGRASRPMHPEWVRELRDYAASAGVAFHFKQWGSYAPRGFASGLLDVDSRAEKVIDGYRCFYYGAASKVAGKMLDFHEWCEFPRAMVPA